MERNAIFTRFYHPTLVATCCNVRLHLSSMGGGRIRGGGVVGGLRHILCPYMGMKFTRSGESSHWSWWMGRRAEGAAKVYIRRERGSRWCEIHSKQIPTEEQRRKGIPLIAFLHLLTQTTLDHLLKTIKKGGWAKTVICIICFFFLHFPLLPFSLGETDF